MKCKVNGCQKTFDDKGDLRDHRYKDHSGAGNGGFEKKSGKKKK